MYPVVKRAFDILLGSALMLIVIITFPFVALGIKLSSPGPILYVSTRVGKNGKTFPFYKYRSMHIDDGTHKGIVAEQNRVFTVGKIIRRTKIDELPQAINILKGDLSVVGPRPMMTTNVSKVYGGRYAPVQTIKPGLTSYASLYDYTHGDALVLDRGAYNSEILPVKQEMELYYLEKASIATDLRIVFKTAMIILSVVFGKKTFEYPKEYYIAKERLEQLKKQENAV